MEKYEEPRMIILNTEKGDIIRTSDGSGGSVELPEMPLK